MTSARWAQLNAVNEKINGSVRYETDLDQYGQQDYWSPAVKAGDCEDFALAKRKALIAGGWPADALSIALVQSPRTGSHAVLVAETAQGDYTLDSTEDWILPWNETDYTWITAQDSSGQWHVAGANAKAVFVATLAAHRNSSAVLAGTAALTAPIVTPAGQNASGGQIPDLAALEARGR